MVVEEVAALLIQMGNIALWLQALGGIIVLWLIFQIVNFFINRKRMKEIYTIKEDMKRMEGKLDRLLRKR
jgi:purine-cytosine permease-like protein